MRIKEEEESKKEEEEEEEMRMLEEDKYWALDANKKSNLTRDLKSVDRNL